MTETQATDRSILPETRALAALGCFDLLATVYLLATHQAQEANPVMAGILATLGPGGFAAIKAGLLGVPLVIAELARKHSPVFVPRALRVGLICYVVALLIAYRPLLLRFAAGYGSNPGSYCGLTVRPCR